MKKLTVFFLTLLCLCVVGCGSKNTQKEEKTSTGTAKTEMNTTITCDELNFRVEVINGKKYAFKEGDGLYIYTDNEGYIPYVLIYRSSATYNAQDFLTDFGKEMEEKYGDDFEGYKSVKEYEKGGKKLLGIEYAYKIDGESIQAIRLIEEHKDGYISYIAKYPREEGDETLEDLELAVRTIKIDSGSETSVSVSESKKSEEKSGVTIAKTSAQALRDNLVDYANPNGIFTLKAPAGWSISTGGYDMGYWIHLYDPNETNLGLFYLFESQPMLKSKKAKNFYGSLASQAGGSYKRFADMIAADKNNIVESYYKNFMESCAYAVTYDPTYSGFTFPQISNFEAVEAWNNQTYVTPVALEDKVIRANFTNTLSGEKAEGLFTGSAMNALTLFQDGYDCGCYALYNVSGIFAPYGRLNEYREILMYIMDSITFSESFIKTAINDSNIAAQGARTVSDIMGETSDIIVRGWEARQKTYDISAAKYSDSVLGYERVYNVDTHEVYEADLGFMDAYDGTLYKPATDDMYLERISGHIYIK